MAADAITYERSAPGRAEAIQPTAKTGAVFRAAQRHSRRVRVMRLALPLVAVVCVLVFSWFTFFATPAAIKVNVASIGIENGKLVMVRPKLSGFTSKDLPYAMEASRATQQIGNTSVFNLDNIDATLPLAADRTAAVQAGSGVFDNTKKTLSLGSGITVKTSDGATALLKSAEIDVGKGQMHTNEPVIIDNGDTRLKADTMSVSKDDGVIVFDRHVDLVIQPAALQKNGMTKAPAAPSGK